jgi:dihydroorotate dehydrogenase (NAD+) catalytic subunit
MRLLNASGCLDAVAAPQVAQQLDVFVTKTVTPLPRHGNAPVRIVETEVGMLNSIGLANPGIDRFVADVLPRLEELGLPIWVSVGGFSAADYAHCCGLLDECDAVVAVELNVSCPNVDPSEDGVEEVVSVAREATAKTMYAKLSPAVPDVAALAVAAEHAGADGLSLVNTIRGAAVDPETLRPILGTVTGGLSGPALKPIALAAVYACRGVTTLPIVGMGGIGSGADALDFLASGATDVAIGTALFADPGAPARIRAELADKMATHRTVPATGPDVQPRLEGLRPTKTLQIGQNERS